MKTRCCIILIIFSIAIFFDTKITHAADDLYNVCNSFGDQDALIVGKVINIDSDATMQVEIVRLVSGVVIESKDYKINVQCSNIKRKFEIGNEVLLSVMCIKEKDALYKISYDHACYTVKCMKDNKIEILQNKTYNYGINDFDYFDIVLQWFCNTGEILAEEDTLDNCLFYRWEGGKKQLVYNTKKDIWYQDSFSSEFVAPDIIKEEKTREMKIIFCLLIGSIGSIILLYRWIKTNKKMNILKAKKSMSY